MSTMEKPPMTTNATTPDSQSLGENGHTSQDDHSKETKVVSAAPDGGLQAWLVAAGAGCVFFSCLGFANSFGSFAQFYITHQLSDRSEDDIAWIGSLSATLQFVTGLIGGPLFDRYGTRVIWPSCIIYLFSVMMLSLCDKYWHFMLVQGVVMGSIMGFLQFPAIAAVAQFFDKKRGAALGIAISGSSIGGIIIPILVSKMLNGTSLGFAWTVRITGFIMIPFLGFAIATIRTRVPPRATALLPMEALKDRKLIGMAISIFFTFAGMFMPLFFLPTYATMIRHMDPTLAGYLLAILNAASTFGRIIPGALADKYGRFNVYSGGCIVTGIVIFFMNFTNNTAGIVVYCIVVGFATGTLISGASTVLASCAPSPQVMGSYSGMGLALGAIGGLIGPPINGKFVSHYGGFLEASMFSGAMCVVGGIIGLVTKALTPDGILGVI